MPETHLPDFVRKHAQHKPDSVAIISGQEEVSWRQLYERMVGQARRFYSKLDKYDSQQVIAVAAPNSIDFIATYLGILELGHIVMPIDIGYKAMEVESICSQIKPVLALYDDKSQALFKNVSVPQASYIEEGSEAPTNDYQKITLPAAEQIATLLFTSGTTGAPKAAPYTHANHLWNITASSPLWKWNDQDRMLLSLPLSHWYGIVMGLSGVIYHGHSMVLQPHFSAEATLERLSQGDITFFTHVAPAYIKMAQTNPDKHYDLSHVRVCISGAAPLPPSIWKAFKKRFGIEIIEAYGSSETGRIASNSLSDRHVGSPGKPMPGVKYSFGDHRELLIKSPGLFPGYYKNPQATAEKMTAEGWWHTGDMAEIKDGRIILKGRRFERIVKYGYTLYPRDIEWVLLHMLGIREAHVVGIAHKRELSDEVIYVIAGDVSEAAIRDYCHENMPSAWRPDRIVFVDTLPKTSSGKPKITQIKHLISGPVHG